VGAVPAQCLEDLWWQRSLIVLMSGFSRFAYGALFFPFFFGLVQYELTFGFSFCYGWYADSTTIRLYDWHG
jgi:hypothetical protein